MSLRVLFDHVREPGIRRTVVSGLASFRMSLHELFASGPWPVRPHGPRMPLLRPRWRPANRIPFVGAARMPGLGARRADLRMHHVQRQLHLNRREWRNHE
ncbi:hypothetical protein Daura_09950 [Dactylosporangium aurantiacum]|uniref:Uncharacterized protein n=2 Tax=Dactylosporangium aurantiacum TaxID=35754 RepID=A0A9Q9IKE3_9ACTN|nr:hypothetical protein [Dactylosporangium aurantiacum]MDG6109357.1 hypothetical protein [Dactylosporangium aurantiacum]UWZ56463.1 hypothetical protein Daura_09950 [Dactylosporangium aurantiacum]